MNKVIGFQVINNDTKDIHPEMAGSFCVYSMPQCMKMLKDKSGTERDKYTIVTIKSGDIEEPTIMFKGYPLTAEIQKLISSVKKTYEPKHFLLTEGGDSESNSVIGVVSAFNDEELNKKAKIAISEHFDVEVKDSLKLESENYLYGVSGSFEVSIPFDGDDDYKATINIQSVEVY